jgi:hypothetical protein
MTQANGQSRLGGKPTRVAVVMLVVFLLAVGGAWWLVWARTIRPRGRGQRLLDGIRGDGLHKLLDETTDTGWFIRFDSEGRPLGFEGRRQIAVEEGYVGGSLQFIAETREMVVEIWRVSNDIRTVRYRAAEGLRLQQYRAFPDVPDVRRTLASAMAGGRLEVEVRVARNMQVRNVSGETPANLIPEGVGRAVVKRVAKADGPLTCKLMLNSDVIQAGRMHLTTAHFTPLAPDRVEMTYRATNPQPHRVTVTYRLDDDGRVLEIRSPQSLTRRVQAADIWKTFGGVARFAYQTLYYLLKEELDRVPTRMIPTTRRTTSPKSRPTTAPADPDALAAGTPFTPKLR